MSNNDIEEKQNAPDDTTDVDVKVHLMKEDESQEDLFGAFQSLRDKGNEEEIEKFFSMTDRLIIVLKLIGVLGGVVLMQLSYGLVSKSREYTTKKNEDDNAKKDEKYFWARDATASGRIFLLIFTFLIGMVLFAYGAGKIYLGIIAKDIPQVKAEYMKSAGLLRQGGLSKNIPYFLQAIGLNHLQNVSKTKYFVELFITGIVGFLMAIIGFVRFWIEIIYAFFLRTEATINAGLDVKHGALGVDPGWVKNGLSTINLYNGSKCKGPDGKPQDCTPLYFPKDFLSTVIFLFGLFLILYHAGGVIVWLIIMFGSIIGKIIGKVLNSLRCNFNSNCEEEIQDIHTYNKDEIDAAKKVSEEKKKQDTIKVQNIKDDKFFDANKTLFEENENGDLKVVMSKKRDLMKYMNPKKLSSYFKNKDPNETDEAKVSE